MRRGTIERKGGMEWEEFPYTVETRGYLLSGIRRHCRTIFLQVPFGAAGIRNIQQNFSRPPVQGQNTQEAIGCWCSDRDSHTGDIALWCSSHTGDVALWCSLHTGDVALWCSAIFLGTGKRWLFLYIYIGLKS